MIETMSRSAYMRRKIYMLQFDADFESVVLFSLLGLVLSMLLL